MKRPGVALGIAAAAAAWLGVATPFLAGADGVTVEVGHNRLSPAEFSIAVGDEVTFVNQDQMPGGHTLVADDESFSSPPLAKGESWTHAFESAGKVPYHIKEHPGAKGTISVE